MEKVRRIIKKSLEKMYHCSRIKYQTMLKRKIEDALVQWKNKPGHKPLMIMGIRQCGKTYISQHFAELNYKNVVYMNFIKQPERIDVFDEGTGEPLDEYFDAKQFKSIVQSIGLSIPTAERYIRAWNGTRIERISREQYR